jgi:MFS transporter, PAT family, beta-lactamase induction signal transducer AmpG
VRQDVPLAIFGARVSLRWKLILVSLLYFAEGFPFGIIEKTFTVYFQRHDWSLPNLGLLSLALLPYALKFLWAPAVDFLGTRRLWIAASQVLMAALLCAFIFLDPTKPGILLWISIFMVATLSATQDIAIDAYTIELLNTSEMGLANGFRIATYRIALLTSGGLFVAMSGRIGWHLTFFVAASVLGFCSIVSLRLPPIEIQRPPFSLKTLVAPIGDLLKRPVVIPVGLFILLYKLGDMSMAPMVIPFWGISGLGDDAIGLITGLGMGFSIAGGLAGGVFMARFGIFHGLWFLGLWQAVSNLGYAWVATYPAGNLGIYIASAIESFCAGLGTAAFLAFLMSICEKRFSATQYAVLSALFRVSGIMAGAPSGWLAQYTGFAQYFLFTFFLSLPALALVGYARKWIPSDSGSNSDEPSSPNKT